jgi:hypothetical protein
MCCAVQYYGQGVEEAQGSIVSLDITIDVETKSHVLCSAVLRAWCSVLFLLDFCVPMRASRGPALHNIVPSDIDH